MGKTKNNNFYFHKVTLRILKVSSSVLDFPGSEKDWFKEILPQQNTRTNQANARQQPSHQKQNKCDENTNKTTVLNRLPNRGATQFDHCKSMIVLKQ